MKKATKNLLLSLFVIALAGCTTKNNDSNSVLSDNKTSQESSSLESETQEIVFVNLPTNPLTAELGEKCDIPEVIAKRGNKEIEVNVTVKDSKNQDTEIIGRGTRFIAEDVNGYTIIYTAMDNNGSKKAEIKVNVSDTVGPEVKFDQDVSNICVSIGSVVTIPTATWQDNSGVVKDSSCKVTFNGKEVLVEQNKFTASEYGVYNVEYMASDAKGNITKKIVLIDCARMVLLNNFNDLSSVWANEEISELTSEHAIEGNAFKVTGNNEWNQIAVYPEYYDLSGFDKLQISIYASKDIDSGEEGFYLLNKKYTLSQGLNIVTISKEEFASQYENCKIPSENPKYYDYQFIWFQLKSNGGSIYLDNFVGVFNNYTVDSAAPTIDFGKAISHDKTNILEGTNFAVPEAKCYDNSMENIEVSYNVFTKNKENITELVKQGNYVAVKDEEYTIEYTASDSNNNQTSKTISVIVDPKAIIPDLNKEDYFPTNRLYDVLNDFENTGVDWCLADKEFVTEHVMNGETALRLSTTKADQCIVLKILKNGKVLSTSDFAKYESIKIYVYSDSANARFDFYGKTYPLNEGPNVLVITPEEILKEIEKASNVYDATGGFYFQLTTGTVYVDSLIGIYPEGYQEVEPPVEVEKPEEIVNYYPTDRKYDMLQDFETEGAIDTWFFPNSEKLSDKYSVTGNSFHVNGDGNYAKLPMIMLKDGKVLTLEDWNKYESFKLAIYSETPATFCFLNKIYALEEGYNVITISKEDMLAQINGNAECYTASGYFWCQVNGTGVSLYFDSLIGIYPQE